MFGETSQTSRSVLHGLSNVPSSLCLFLFSFSPLSLNLWRMFVKAPNSCALLLLLHPPFIIPSICLFLHPPPPSLLPLLFHRSLFVSWLMFIRGFQGRQLPSAPPPSSAPPPPVSLFVPRLSFAFTLWKCLSEEATADFSPSVNVRILTVTPITLSAGSEVLVLVQFTEFLLNAESCSRHIVWMSKETEILRRQKHPNLQQICAAERHLSSVRRDFHVLWAGCLKIYQTLEFQSYSKTHCFEFRRDKDSSATMFTAEACQSSCKEIQMESWSAWVGRQETFQITKCSFYSVDDEFL